MSAYARRRLPELLEKIGSYKEAGELTRLALGAESACLPPLSELRHGPLG